MATTLKPASWIWTLAHKGDWCDCGQPLVGRVARDTVSGDVLCLSCVHDRRIEPLSIHQPLDAA
jgi:hypothetical protein